MAPSITLNLEYGLRLFGICLFFITTGLSYYFWKYKPKMRKSLYILLAFYGPIILFISAKSFSATTQHDQVQDIAYHYNLTHTGFDKETRSWIWKDTKTGHIYNQCWRQANQISSTQEAVSLICFNGKKFIYLTPTR